MRIDQLEMDHLDREIKNAKETEDRLLKKKLKLRFGEILKHSPY
jgi:hypothetical protein